MAYLGPTAPSIGRGAAARLSPTQGSRAGPLTKKKGMPIGSPKLRRASSQDGGALHGHQAAPRVYECAAF